MDEIMCLEPGDLIEARPFTHPDHTYPDLLAMRFMADRVCLIMEQPGLYAGRSCPIIFRQQEPDGRSHRVVICNPQQLVIPGPLMVVGFFGQRRPKADIKPLLEWDKKLVAQFPLYPGLYSYSTLLLKNGDFGNLVVFKDESVKAEWQKDPVHREVTGDISANYYASIRLYNGIARDGIMDSDAIFLQRVKYYEYPPCGAVWRGVRRLQGMWAGTFD